MSKFEQDNLTDTVHISLQRREKRFACSHKQDPGSPGIAVKQELEENSRNHVQTFFLVSVEFQVKQLSGYMQDQSLVTTRSPSLLFVVVALISSTPISLFRRSRADKGAALQKPPNPTDGASLKGVATTPAR